MKGVLIHGALLGVMLIYGYRTWTADEDAKPSTGGDVVLWTRDEASLTKLELQTENRLVRLERRGQGADAYWWGSEAKTVKKPKPAAPTPTPTPTDPAGAGSGSGSAAPTDPAGAGSGSAAPTPPPPAEPEFITETTTSEFPVGPEGEKLVKQFARMRAIRSVGVPKDDAKKDYGLEGAQTSIAVVFGDGAKTLVVGGRVFGGSDRYVQDLDTNKAFVITGTMVSLLEGGEPSLRPIDLRPFEPKDAVSVELAAKDQKKRVQRIKVKPSTPEGDDPHAPPPNADALVETWGEGATADTVAANFLDKLEKLRPTSYDPKLDAASLELVVSATYRDAKGKALGTVKLLRRVTPAPAPVTPPTPDQPATPATPGQPAAPATPGQPATPDAAAPPAAEPPKAADKVEYFLWTERTRVPGLLTALQAERVEQDVPTLFAK
jgi:hypothetical protein